MGAGASSIVNCLLEKTHTNSDYKVGLVDILDSAFEHVKKRLPERTTDVFLKADVTKPIAGIKF